MREFKQAYVIVMSSGCVLFSVVMALDFAAGEMRARKDAEDLMNCDVWDIANYPAMDNLELGFNFMSRN